LVIQIDPSTNLRIIIPTTAVVEPRLGIVIVPTVADGVDGADAVGGVIHHRLQCTVGGVVIAYHTGAAAVKQSNDIPHEIVLIIVLGAVDLNSIGRAALVVQVNQRIAAGSLPIQHAVDIVILGDGAAHRLGVPSAVGIVHKGGGGSVPKAGNRPLRHCYLAVFHL